MDNEGYTEIQKKMLTKKCTEENIHKELIMKQSLNILDIEIYLIIEKES